MPAHPRRLSLSPRGGLLLLLLALLAGPLPGCAPAATRRTPPPGTVLRNPLRPAPSPDPYLVYAAPYYYLTYTENDRVSLYRATTLAGLASARGHVLWAPGCCRVWAPELHLLPYRGQPRWHVYYTRDYSLYVRVSAGPDPLGPYGPEIALVPASQSLSRVYAIDPTVLRQGGGLYLLWSDNENLAIARMTDSTSLPRGPDGRVRGVQLPANGRAFGCTIQEAPAVLHRHGRFFVTFSACDSRTADYRLGMLTAADSANLLDPRAWAASPRPVFARADAAGVYGPGHNGFFTSPDGREDWIVYHAKSGAASGYADRSTRAQRLTWRADGTPEFGTPVGTGTALAAPSGETPGGAGAAQP